MQAEELILSLNEARPILIAGATASGKSALAIKIAKKLGGVITVSYTHLRAHET